MAKGPPKTVTIDHDDYSAKYVGKTADGNRFFLTHPFVPKKGDDAGREFLALYRFDKAGVLVSATIEDLGPRDELEDAAVSMRTQELLASLGKVVFGRIKVAPFEVERFGVTFGFLPQEPDEPGADWSVVVEPGNYMCFWPPWTSGEYDT